MDRSSGGLAQLGERGVRNAEVEGSNPLPSTIVPFSWVAAPSRGYAGGGLSVRSRPMLLQPGSRFGPLIAFSP